MNCGTVLPVCVSAYVVVAWIIAFVIGLCKSHGSISDMELFTVVFWPLALTMLGLVILSDMLTAAWGKLPKRDALVKCLGYLLLPVRPYAFGQLIARLAYHAKGVKA